ncbi:hypothetical protein [Mesorhizobium sp. B2-3-5]|uniref:hypothetical protein n=1 Tax=Mesorhizobium sp. B2-3-5 TaxID=2589958 RepID=UPI0015E2D934|nr:hypothetical protein [Mesorhizobium sp. B2-3-5]
MDGERVFATYSALCGQGIPAASPQRDAVGTDLVLICSDWRTSSAKTSAKLPSMTKTTIRRVTGNVSASSGWRISRDEDFPGIMRTNQKCRSLHLTSRRIQRYRGRPTLPMPANMIDPRLREFKPRLNHHIRWRSDMKRDLPAWRRSRGVVSQADTTALFADSPAHATPALARPESRQSVAIGEP